MALPDLSAFHDFLRTAYTDGFVGVNVTLPYKRAALAAATHVTPLAREIGAANLLTFGPAGEIAADNTDGPGFLAAIADLRINAATHTVILGAGGAVPALLWALRQRGIRRPQIFVRDIAKARTELGAEPDIRPWGAYAADSAGAGLLINATPLGLPGAPALDLPLDPLSPHASVIDIIPAETELIRRARARGLAVQNGVPMLVHQAVPSFAAFFGTAPDDPARAILYLDAHVCRAPLRRLVLTGGIGMGKSTVAAMFAAEGVPVFDADRAVHELYEPGGAATPAVLAAFPAARGAAGGVDRQALGQIVLGEPPALAQLEALVHPFVAAAREAFFAQAANAGEALALAEVPLLAEHGRPSGETVIVVSAPASVQAARVMARPHMTAEKFTAIAARQATDAARRAMADHIVETGGTMAQTQDAVRELIDKLRGARLSPAAENHGTD